MNLLKSLFSVWKELDKKNKLSWSFFSLALFVHFFSVCYFSVNVPYWDEWEVLRPMAMNLAFDWNYLLNFHTENRHLTSKFLTWLFLRYDAWNLKHQIILNGLFYISGVLLYLRSFQKLLIHCDSPQANRQVTSPWWLPLIFSIFFSPQMYENSLWAWQANYILAFFFLSACLFMFAYLDKIFAPFLLTPLMILAAYSIGFGLIVTVFVALGVLLYLIQKRIWKYKFQTGLWLASYSLYIYSIVAWFDGRPNSASAPMALDPNLFLKHLLGLWSLMIGNHTETFFILGTFPIYISMKFVLKFLKTKSKWIHLTPYLFFALGTSALLVVVSYSRHSMGSQQAYSSRYYLYAFMLIPFLSFFELALEPKSEIAKKTSLVISSIIFIGFLNDWSFSHYSSTQEERIDQLKCLISKTQERVVDCGNSYPGDLRPMLDRAIEMNLLFTQGMRP